MIKVYVRAIVHYKGKYVLMGETDRGGNQTWDLPGGELEGGKEVKSFLQQLVLQNVGYEVSQLRFYEIVCNVRRRARGVEPLTTLEFIFTCHVDSADMVPPAKQIDLLPDANFEWLASDGRFHMNKVMRLLGAYHQKQGDLHDRQLRVQND